MANFIDAGNNAVQKAVAARKALAESKADLSKIGKTAIQQDAYNVKATADRNAKSAIAKNDLETAKKGAEMKSAYEKETAGIVSDTQMAGKLAAGVGMMGSAAILMNKKEEPNEMLSQYQSFIDKYKGRADTARAEYDAASNETYTGINPDSLTKPAEATAPVPQGEQGSGVLGKPGSIFQQAADITGLYESDSSGGYDAYNLGGSDEGRTAHGSGNSADGKQFGSALTSMPLSQIKNLQSSGKLHAAGRFQFVGNSLPEAAQFAGLSDDALFTPENQKKMFMAFGKKYGSGRWVGLSKASQSERDIVDQAFSQWQP